MGNGTELGRVRGLGSAHSGAHHWILQRVTAIANLALLVWLLVSLLTNDVSTGAAVKTWLSSPVAAVPMALLAISVFTHIRLGLQVLIEDYVHEEGAKFASLVALTFYTFGSGALAVFAIAKIALTGTAH